MTRTPLALAALASAAVPGLDPASVAGVVQRPGHQFEVVFIEDTQHRRWVLRAPMSAAAGAQMDVSVALLSLLARRLPFSVPTPRGFVGLKEGGRAMVYPYITGRPLDFSHLPAGPGIAAELGRALAAFHNIELALCEEAGLTSYDPDTYRTRRLSDLDRAAATGHVPTGLLSRWERSLEEVSLWRFAPTPTHGDLTGDEVLAVFEDDNDATTGRVRGLTGWENAKVADPADDFATLVTQASPSALDSVLEAYAAARLDRPDKHLERRARLAGELKLVSELLVAVGSRDQRRIAACAQRLRQLEADTHDTPISPDPETTKPSDVSQIAEATELIDVSQAAAVSRDTDISRDTEVTQTINVSHAADVSRDTEATQTINVSHAADVSRDTEATQTIDVPRDTDVPEDTDVLEVGQQSPVAAHADTDGQSQGPRLQRESSS